MDNIIDKLKSENLLGRGGAGFPAGLKWEAVKNAKGSKKYVICNASEGEPYGNKDKFILDNYPEEVIEGIKIAIEEIKAQKAYIYLNKDYYKELKSRLEKLSKGLPIVLFKKTGGYISGEETTLLNAIEGKLEQPRLKPPYPTESGLFGCPTLINNVETFYCVSKISKDKYKHTRFYSISGDVQNRGVYELPQTCSVKQVLEKTKNFPDFDFFIQAGGGACGEILLPEELERPVCGAGIIVVYNKKKTDLMNLLKTWAYFFFEGNCDKCVPCREGGYRIKEMIDNGDIDREKLKEIFFAMENTSFCPLGKMSVTPFKTLIDKLWK